ncbi:TPA: hypothetical protein N0F65_003031 [Lagenidium giganteum]|uniref:Major facilitator superfamily (MFS) profile domain-containing protein n=1 Tax=Lagenidium giganteum TaxID=4803 RepID=A0AAV2YTX4_9STRA|nr:TPA: hypothetical protein N0F65_003031 [Lagenidium giganteum]
MEAGYASVSTPCLPTSIMEDSAARAYSLPVEKTQFDRATKIKPLSLLRPHMRIFHLTWLSAITGFCGWYALPPLMPVIKDTLHLTDSQVLNSDIMSTASTILTRVLAGPLLDAYGPQLVQSYVLGLGAIPVFCAAFVSSATTLVIVRFFIGLVGCVFVSSQYWTTITFAKNVVATSNAITGGLGLAGIGFAFLLLPYVHDLVVSGGASVDMAWRITVALPAVLMVAMGLVIRYCVDSCPMGEFERMKQAKNEASTVDAITAFGVVLHQRNTYILVLNYALCFGAELQLNNMGALYFYEEFMKPGCHNKSDASCHRLTKTQAATIASSFGLMNLFARAIGGIVSDVANRRHGMCGRKWIQFVYLCVEGALVLALSQVRSLGGCIALYVLTAMAAQGSGGSTFGIVPYVNELHTGSVTGLVGAGGNVGGVVFGLIFKSVISRHEGFLVMGIVILVCALSTWLLHFEQEQHNDIQHPFQDISDSTSTVPATPVSQLSAAK